MAKREITGGSRFLKLKKHEIYTAFFDKKNSLNCLIK